MSTTAGTEERGGSAGWTVEADRQFWFLGPRRRLCQVFRVMSVAELVELFGLTRRFGGQRAVYRPSADEQDIEACACSFGLRKKATLREQFLHFEGVV